MAEKQHSTEQCFGRALRYAERLYARQHRRGFQARLAEATSVPSSNLSEIVKKDRGAGEDTRRKILAASIKLVPALAGMSYDIFLEFGCKILLAEEAAPGGILSDAEEDEILKRVISSGSGYTLPAPQITAHANVVQNGVNNGVMSVVDNKTEQRDEFRAEIEGWTTECFSKLSLSAKCTVRDAMLKSVPGFAEYVAQKEQQGE